MGRWKFFWVWVAASVVVAIARLATASDLDHGLPNAVGAVARVGYLPFWLSYTGGAWVALGVRQFAVVRDHVRELGFGFAAAIAIHLGLIGWQIYRGFAPGPELVIIFGAAALLTLLLCVVSLPASRERLPRVALARFRTLATTYIALVYLKDFAIPPQPASPRYWIFYGSFAALGAIGFGVRALAGLRDIRWLWRRSAAAPR